MAVPLHILYSLHIYTTSYTPHVYPHPFTTYRCDLCDFDVCGGCYVEGTTVCPRRSHAVKVRVCSPKLYMLRLSKAVYAFTISHSIVFRMVCYVYCVCSVNGVCSIYGVCSVYGVRSSISSYPYFLLFVAQAEDCQQRCRGWSCARRTRAQS
jgi:hypothetical protein